MKKILFCLCLLTLAIFSFSVSVYAQAAPVGACCYAPDDNHCASPLTESACTEISYAVWYENVTCAENPCSRQQSIPTMTDWGMIIFMVLAGLSSVYYLRRQRKEKNS